MRWPALLALGGAVLLAGGAEARKPKRAAPHTRVRPEFDPKLSGHAPEFARARVLLEEPSDLAVIALAADAIKVVLQVEGYALGPAGGQGAPFALLLIDDEVALRIDDAATAGPLLLRGLRPGPHLLRAVLSRPWGEVVKAPGALALARIWVGPRIEGPAGKAAEGAVWPDPKKPLLTCVFPLPEGKESGPTLEPYGSPAPTERAGDAEASATSTRVGVPPAGGDVDNDSTTKPLAAAPRPALPRRGVLDFFLSGATLRPRGRGDKLRLVVDKKEYPLVREWKPVPLKLKPGAHRLTVDLLDRRGTKVRNAVNRTDRAFTLPE